MLFLCDNRITFCAEAQKNIGISKRQRRTGWPGHSDECPKDRRLYELENCEILNMESFAMCI